MGAQVPALVAPRFDVDSSYRLAPEWGQVGTGTVSCAATSVHQGVPRVGGPVMAPVHPSNLNKGGGARNATTKHGCVSDGDHKHNRRHEVSTASSQERM